jgi:16S rRNA (uracil1498-N3)-methyltransferase
VRRRFFIEEFKNGQCVVTGETALHLGRVLRAQAGQLYELSDGERVWLGRIEKVARDGIEFALIEELAANAPTLALTLLLAVVKFDRFEWALEKATELGVSSIVPLAAARSEKALTSAAVKRAARWRKILVESSQQSRRVRVPSLETLAKPEAAFAGRREALRLLLSERSGAQPMRNVLRGSESRGAVFAVGPEGGWTDEEFAAAQKAGFQEVGLGNLILRTETAVTAGLAALNYALGEE